MMLTLCTVVLFAQGLSPEAIEHTQAGTEAQKQGNFDKAITEFRLVTEMQPTLAAAFANLGTAYFQKGAYDQAVPSLQRALELNPQLMGVEQALGVSLLVEGNAAAALPHLEKGRIPELLGVAYLETGKLGNAIGALQAALSRQPNDPDLLYYFGKATELASKQAFDQIVQTAPDSARAHEVKGDRYSAGGQLPQAGKEYFEALRLKPFTAGIHLALGEALAGAGNWAAAAGEFEAEAKLRPGSAEAFYRLGSALERQGKTAEALKALSRANELNPESPAVLLELGKSAAANGDAASAEKSLRKLAESQKAGEMAAQAHFELAALYRKAGRTADAERESGEYERLKSGAPR